MDNLIRVVDVRDFDAFAQPLYEFASMHAHLARTPGNRA